MTQERELTVEEAAARLEIEAETVEEWLRVGRLKAARPVQTEWRIKESDLEAFIEHARASSSEEAT